MDIKLTPYGEAVVQSVREKRDENIERNGGQYVEEPWYYRYLSPEYVASHPVAYVDEEEKQKLNRSAEIKNANEQNKKDKKTNSKKEDAPDEDVETETLEEVSTSYEDSDTTDSEESYE